MTQRGYIYRQRFESRKLSKTGEREQELLQAISGEADSSLDGCIFVEDFQYELMRTSTEKRHAYNADLQCLIDAMEEAARPYDRLASATGIGGALRDRLLAPLDEPHPTTWELEDIASKLVAPTDGVTLKSLQRLLQNDPAWITSPAVQVLFMLAVRANQKPPLLSRERVRLLQNGYTPKAVTDYLEAVEKSRRKAGALGDVFTPASIACRNRKAPPDSELFVAVNLVEGALLKCANSRWDSAECQASMLPFRAVYSRLRGKLLSGAGRSRGPRLTAIHQVAYMLKEMSWRQQLPWPLMSEDKWLLSPRTIRQRLSSLPLKSSKTDVEFEAIEDELRALGEEIVVKRAGIARSSQ